MEREPQKLVDEIRANGGEVYSFSRLECINNCLYEAYMTYVINEKEEQIPNIYSVLGGRIHDVLEGIMNNKNTVKDLLPAMNQELEDMDMLGIEFPKGRDGSDIIREGWIKNMTHFCKSYKPPKGKFETETFFLYKTPGGHYIQGFIDLTKIHKNGMISIYDYKTSSMYKGDDIQKHGRQLVLYALGKEQEGYKIKEIAWLMLKYVEVTYIGKKRANSKEESEITKVIERKKLVKELVGVIDYKLEKYHVDEVDREIIIEEAKERNVIPEILQCEFKVKPYVMKYDLTDEIRAECNEYIDSTIDKWESLDPNNEFDYPPLSFTKTRIVKKKNDDGSETEEKKEIEDAFYHYSLCGYSKICPHFQKYLATKQSYSEDDNLW